MSKAAVIFWSQTGNTEQMANAIAEGIREGGMECDLLNVADTNANDASAYAKIALGCPAMGNEELEEYEFEPFFADILPQLKDKTVGIFGSYAWNQGDWIENWKNRLDEAGVKLAADPVKAYSYPDDEALEACKKLGETVAKA